MIDLALVVVPFGVFLLAMGVYLGRQPRTVLGGDFEILRDQAAVLVDVAQRLAATHGPEECR